MNDPITGRQGNWTAVLLENGLTAGAYAEELRGSDPRKPDRTYDQIRAYLAEEGCPVSENQVRTHFRRVGQTAPYPGQAIETTRYVKGDTLPAHPSIIDHPEWAQALAPTDGVMTWVSATPGARFIEHGVDAIGMGVTGGDSVAVTRNADGSLSLAHSDGSSVTAHLDGGISGVGALRDLDRSIEMISATMANTERDRFFAAPPPVLGDNWLRIHKQQKPPAITPLGETGAAKTIGEVLSGYQAELAEEYDEKRDSETVEQMVEAERKKVAARQEDRLKRQWIKRQALIDEFVAGVKESIEPIEYAPYIPHVYTNAMTGNQAAVLYLSDAHIGKLTESFNIAVIQDRLGQIINYVRESVRRQRMTKRVDELHILFGGDLVDGANVFPTQTYHSEQNIKNQIFRSGVPFFSALIRDLATDFARVTIAPVPGNHGRGGKFAHEEDNADAYFYWALALACANLENVDWHLSAHWFNIHHVLNTNILLVHGHQHLSQQGVPYYAITRKAMSWQQTMPERFDIEMMGHLHSPAQLDVSGIDVIVNGSMVTGDEYALEKMGAQSAPVQTFLFIDEQHGLVERQLIHLH